MAFLARIYERMASETTAFVEHRELRVATRLELREREVAAWGLVVASAAIIGDMAFGTGCAIKRRVFSVNVILPPRRMRYRHHNLMTTCALLLAHG